jgi:hypothetical protein
MTNMSTLAWLGLENLLLCITKWDLSIKHWSIVSYLEILVKYNYLVAWDAIFEIILNP